MPKLRKLALISVHTSPLETPGVGDAGGMNVYIDKTSRELAKRGIEIDIFTRATSKDQPAIVDVADGVRVRHIQAGPFGGLQKQDLPGQLCAMTAGVMLAEAEKPEGWYDLIHAHYWLSGQVGWLARDKWQVPLIHSMHTMAKVKNLSLAEDDSPEPLIRIIGEEQVVKVADRLVANTHREAAELIDLYDASPSKVDVVHPGVDLDIFNPHGPEMRKELGIAENDFVVLFVGRIQPLKAPDVLLKVASVLKKNFPSLGQRLKVVICGGLSGSGTQERYSLPSLASDLGLSENVIFLNPLPPQQLASLYRSADVLAVPSHSESFGLVALEASACGTPVVAAAVGGLVTSVKDNISGLLVGNHDLQMWAEKIADIALNSSLAETLRQGGIEHARKFTWEITAQNLAQTYERSIFDFRRTSTDKNSATA
ncbi:MAG: hypothetical protein RIS09_740 [Actinomycetota bacterium]